MARRLGSARAGKKRVVQQLLNDGPELWVLETSDVQAALGAQAIEIGKAANALKRELDDQHRGSEATTLRDEPHTSGAERIHSEASSSRLPWVRALMRAALPCSERR